MQFKDSFGNEIKAGDLVLTPGFFLATVTAHDPKIYGDDQPMVTIHNKHNDLVFYHSEELVKVRLNGDTGEVILDITSRYEQRPDYE